MPINVFGNSSNNSEQKIDTSLFVRKPFLRTNYIEANIEEGIDLKNQYRIKNLPDPISIGEPVSKSYVDNKFNDPSIIKNTDHVDFNDKILDNVYAIRVNSNPILDAELTSKFYVDNFIFSYVDEKSLLRVDPKSDIHFGKLDSIFVNSPITSPRTIIELPTRSYVDSLHEINRDRRDLSSVFNDQDNEFDNNKLTNLDSITVNRDPNLDNELSNKKYVDNSIGECTLLRFNQTLENYFKVSVGNDTYNLTKYNKIQITDTTEMRYPNIGCDLLQKWNIKCNNKNNVSKVGDFIKPTKTHSPTGYSGAMSLPPIGNSFMYIETSSNNHGHERVFVSWERTDIIQINNITFYYNRFSILTNDSLKSMGRFRIQLLLEDNTWSTRYNIPKNDRYSDSSTDWSKLSLNFTVENYGIRLIYDEIDTAHADMCFSNITITHSIY